MSVRPGQIRAESQDGVAMIPVALAMRHRYQELAMPVVIMAGTKDRVVKDSQAIGFTRKFRTAIFRLVPDVGHMLHYAVPEEVAESDRGSRKTSNDIPPRGPSFCLHDVRSIDVLGLSIWGTSVVLVAQSRHMTSLPRCQL